MYIYNFYICTFIVASNLLHLGKFKECLYRIYPVVYQYRNSCVCPLTNRMDCSKMAWIYNSYRKERMQEERVQHLTKCVKFVSCMLILIREAPKFNHCQPSQMAEQQTVLRRHSRQF